MWFTCPCEGFAFGEGGIVDLVRLRNGAEVDRLALAPLFTGDFSWEPGEAVLQRWPVEKKDGTQHSAAFRVRVHARSIVRIVQLGDFDHDGKAAEFFLQTGAGPCVKQWGIVQSANHTARDPYSFKKL